MTMPDLPEIADVKRLTLRPGDSLVVRLARPPTDYDAATIKGRLRAILGRDDLPVLVIGPSDDIEVLTTERTQP